LTIVIENGSGVVGANSYFAASFVTTYLADRNRAGEGGWTTPTASAEDAACVAATDHIENAYRARFRGQKQWGDISLARATWTPTAQPLATETVVIGTKTYTFVASLSSANDVLIGASLSASIDNLVAAVLASPAGSGVTFDSATTANDDATAMVFIDDSMLVFSKTAGTPGNSVVTTTTVTGATWNFATLVGGSDIVRPQPLSFPRSGLFDRDGLRIDGIPLRLQYAGAEYAVRARAATLAPDPTADAVGGSIAEKFEKVGPIEERTRYVPGTAGGGLGTGTLPAYPAADRLISEFLSSAGGCVIRG